MFKNKVFQFANELEIEFLNFSSLKVFKCVGTCFYSSESESLLVRVQITRAEACDLGSATWMFPCGTLNFREWCKDKKMV